jgi:hypothetical protein
VRPGVRGTPAGPPSVHRCRLSAVLDRYRSGRSPRLRVVTSRLTESGVHVPPTFRARQTFNRVMTERAAASIPPKALAQHADRLSALFDAHADRLYRLARRLVPSADDALDLVQDAFVRAARSPSSIPRGAREEEAWLVRILINVRRDQWRKEVVRKRHELNLRRAAGRQDDPRPPAATSPSRRRDVRARGTLDGRYRVPPWHHHHDGSVASLSWPPGAGPKTQVPAGRIR